MSDQPRKYEFTGATRTLVNGVVVRQIRRVKDGVVGGWIEAETNLTHEGAAWVFGDAQVSGAAQVFGDARVSGDAWVSGDARVFGDAQVEKPFDLLYVAGLPFSVTIQNDGRMSIGCQTRTFAEWREMKCDDQKELDDDKFAKTRAVLLPLLDLMEAWHPKPVATETPCPT